MKTVTYVSIFALFLLSVATPWSSRAFVSGPSASGAFTLVPEDELTKQVEFEASWDERGTATGRMTLRDQARISEQDPESGDRPEEPPAEFFMTADLDSLTIEHNRAVMAGTVRESSHSSYVGRWVQLVVEDNGEGGDKVQWCFCQPEASGWTPVDAEEPRDEGAWAHWWATDAENREDQGIPSVNIIPGNRKSCSTVVLASYDFPEVRGEGQIRVLQ